MSSVATSRRTRFSFIVEAMAYLMAENIATVFRPGIKGVVECFACVDDVPSKPSATIDERSGLADVDYMDDPVCTAYKTVGIFQRQQNENETTRFLCKVVLNKGMEFEVTLFDSYHVGVTVTLSKGGTYAAGPYEG